MNLKKTLIGLLCASMLAVPLAACGGSGTPADSGATAPAGESGGTSTDSGSGGSGSSGGGAQLEAIFVKHALTVEFSEIQWLQDAMERTGVSVNWQEITADWDQKRPTLLASADVPDLVFGDNAIRDTDYAQFPGLFEDFSPLIEQYGPNVQAMFDEHPETVVLATQLDGKIYGLPKYQRFWPDTVTRQFINQQWLDNLGLELPTNWDELYDVLVAFKEQDANGNGDPNDEIPFDWVPAKDTTGGFGNFHVNVLLGSTGIQLSENSQDGYFVEDGVVKNYFMDERYKDLVVFLNKCWSAGLINQEVFSNDYTQYQAVARGNGSDAAVGYTYGWEVSDRFGLELADQYAFLPPLKQSADSTVTPTWGYDYNMLNYGFNMVSMASSCSDKEAAMRLINEFYDPEVSLQVLFGSIGPNIEKGDDGSYTILPPADPAMDPGTWKWTSTFADFGPMFISDTLNVILPTDMQSIDAQTAPLQGALDAIDKDKNVLPRRFIKMSAEDNNTQALVQSSFLPMAMTKWANWISGAEDVNADWDSYLASMEATGIDELTALWQKYYDAYEG